MEAIGFVVQHRLRLSKAHSYPTSDGGYAGAGEGRDSKQYSFTVRQAGGGWICEHQDNAGGRGRFSFLMPP